jgi:hypothetical protein
MSNHPPSITTAVIDQTTGQDQMADPRAAAGEIVRTLTGVLRFSSSELKR